MNKLLKLIGNVIYGVLCQGLNNKRVYDIKTQTQVRVPSKDMTNPVIVSWVTAFVRSVIGELLHNIHILGGTVISVTTDGFLTNLKDVERMIIESNNPLIMKNRFLLMCYRHARKALYPDKDPLALESKCEDVKGIAS